MVKNLEYFSNSESDIESDSIFNDEDNTRFEEESNISEVEDDVEVDIEREEELGRHVVPVSTFVNNINEDQYTLIKHFSYY